MSKTKLSEELSPGPRVLLNLHTIYIHYFMHVRSQLNLKPIATSQDHSCESYLHALKDFSTRVYQYYLAKWA